MSFIQRRQKKWRGTAPEMPLKSASAAGPPCRASGKAARCSLPNSSNSNPVNSAAPAPTTTGTRTSVIPPPSTFTPASPKPSQKHLLVNSMDSGNPAATSCHATTPFSQTQSRCSQKALVRNSGLVKSDIGRITSDDNVATETSLDTKNTMLERFGPQKTIHVEGETVVRSGDVARNEAILSSEQVERPNADDDSSMQPVTRSETEGVASGLAVPATRKRKIVKKIVRVVKKVIKKRVPKRVPMSSSENQGLVEEAGNGVKLNEVTESSNIVRNVVEKSNLVDVVTERTCVLNEVMGRSNITNANLEDRVTKKTITANDVTEKSNIDDRVMETSKVDQAASLLEPIACMKCNDVRDINSVNEEASKLNGGAHVTAPMIDEKGDLRCIMKMETSKVNIVARVPHQMVSEKGNYPIANHCVEKADTKSYDALTGVDGKDLNVSNRNSMEVENVSYAPKINTEREITKHISDHVMESASNDSTVVNQNMDIVNKEDVGPVASQNVGLVGNKSVICVGEKNRSTIGNRGSRNTEVANDAVAPNEGLLLSGELEALERKRRRRTEIFVSGLGEETNENDIRKVFEEAGTVTEVRLMTNSKTGKNKGFAFVRFATAADANKALAKYSKVEICGKQCGAAPVQGNDTIYIGNIDRKWKTEDVRCLLEKAGFEKIDMVILKADPNNMEKNRGFAFVEFETSKDAQIAFNKLQKKNLFGKNLKIKVAWAQPLMEPAEEEILKVKSVYAEYLPSWDEEKVKEYFRRFGEIESIVLAKDLPSSRRKDFAFINYTSRDAALLCIEAIGRERLEDDGSKVKITASLAKPVSKSKQMEHVSSLTSTRLPKKNLKAFQSTAKSYEPRNKGKLAGSSYGQAKVDNSSCMTNELVQILRQQAASSHILPSRNIDTTPPHHHFPLPASKRPFSLVEHDPFYLDPRGLPRQCTGNSYPISGPSASSHGFSMASRPYHHQQALGFTSEPFNWRNMYPSHSQIQEQEAPYYGNYMYRRN